MPWTIDQKLRKWSKHYYWRKSIFRKKKQSSIVEIDLIWVKFSWIGIEVSLTRNGLSRKSVATERNPINANRKRVQNSIPTGENISHFVGKSKTRRRINSCQRQIVVIHEKHWKNEAHWFDERRVALGTRKNNQNTSNF